MAGTSAHSGSNNAGRKGLTPEDRIHQLETTVADLLLVAKAPLA